MHRLTALTLATAILLACGGAMTPTMNVWAQDDPGFDAALELDKDGYSSGQVSVTQPFGMGLDGLTTSGNPTVLMEVDNAFLEVGGMRLPLEAQTYPVSIGGPAMTLPTTMEILLDRSLCGPNVPATLVYDWKRVDTETGTNYDDISTERSGSARSPELLIELSCS